jgi:hypothetical protein
MNLPVTQSELEKAVPPSIYACQCGAVPRIGFIAQPGVRFGTYNAKRIEAIEIRCSCGRAMQEAIDFDETMAEKYPSAYEKVMAALYHWEMAQRFDLPLNRPAELDRLIHSRIAALGGTQIRIERIVMDNQHRQIKGYRELSQPEIDLMNEIKQKGAEMGDLVARLESVQVSAGVAALEGGPEVKVDGRWVSIGKTHLQQGLMALTRAVAQPTFF